ncbi:MAG TPA: hypothetical protein VH394_11505 [Thermoanaerobaculia bacterium]|nr:hypothetical protein [Thermoanaerobaculia bacterium]
MRELRLPSALLVLACLLSGCSAPAPAPSPVTPVSAPEPVQVSAPEPTPTPEPTPQPGPSEPAGATPVLGSHPPAAPATPADDARPAETVDIRGRVVQARRNAQGELPVGTLQVEGPLEQDTRYDKATIHVGHQSKIFLGRDGKPASFGFIHTGDLVEVTFLGPPTEATESHPLKATAAKVVILEHVP